jgi:hypothetical protein
MISAGNAAHPEKLKQITLAVSTPPYYSVAPPKGYIINVIFIPLGQNVFFYEPYFAIPGSANETKIQNWYLPSARKAFRY